MKTKLTELLPELNLIKDAELRDKTVAVWLEAIELGGWKMEEIDVLPFTLLIPDTKISLLKHIRAVTHTAMRAAEVMLGFYPQDIKLNMDYIIVGGLLHDVGKLMEIRPDGTGYGKSAYGKLLRHPFSGAGLALKHGLPETIVHMIAVHAKEGDGGYRCPEAVVIHYADFMNFDPLRNP